MDEQDDIIPAVKQLFKWIAIGMIISSLVGFVIGLITCWLIK